MIIGSDIEKAQSRIQASTIRTPMLSSAWLNEWCGAEIQFKCENLQREGAFKMRGAANAVGALPDALRKKGVITHSSGNHAKALACAAALAGVPAYIVMPENAPRVKIEGVQYYGGHIRFCAPNQAAREEAAAQWQAETGAAFIHPFDNDQVIAGQATCAKEILENWPEVEYLLAPIGGGGLLSGTALSAKYFGRHLKVIGAEPEGAADAYASFKSGKLLRPQTVNTIADGLLTSLCERTFSIIKDNVDDILLVSDAEIVEALRMVLQHLKMLIEPSCAVPLAALKRYSNRFASKKVAVILSGGNVDLQRLASFL